MDSPAKVTPSSEDAECAWTVLRLFYAGREDAPAIIARHVRSEVAKATKELLKDKARLDWMEAHPSQAQVQGGPDDGHTATVWGLMAHSGSFRDAIDTAHSQSGGKAT